MYTNTAYMLTATDNKFQQLLNFNMPSIDNTNGPIPNGSTTTAAGTVQPSINELTKPCS